MSLKKRLFAVIAAVIVCVSVCSCKSKDKQSQPLQNEVMPVPPAQEKAETPAEPSDEGEEKEDIELLASQAMEKMSVIPEYPEGYPTLDDVVAQYEKANMAIGWIVKTEAVASDADDTYSANGMKYYRVRPDCYYGEDVLRKEKPAETEKLIYNLETLEMYLSTLISADEAHDYVLDIDKSFDVPTFIENEDGALYTIPTAFPPAGYGEENTYELTENADGSYTLSVHYTTLDDNDEIKGEHVYNVKYVNKDGRWVFENFRVVKQH